ncbi:MAG: hypothetical protein ACTSUO_00875 [Candidatus Thorarchaeota archaeon]
MSEEPIVQLYEQMLNQLSKEDRAFRDALEDTFINYLSHLEDSLDAMLSAFLAFQVIKGDGYAISIEEGMNDATQVVEGILMQSRDALEKLFNKLQV